MKFILLFLLAVPTYAWSVETSQTSTVTHSSSQRSWSLASEVGFSQLSYKEKFGAAATNLNQTSLNAKISGGYSFENTRWVVGGTVEGSVATLSSNLDSSAHFLTGDFFGAYSLTNWDQPVRLRVVGGMAYLKIFNNDSYGFSDVLAGLELYPEVSKRFSNGQIINSYVKFVPLFYQGGHTAYHSSDWESSLGVSYEFSHPSDGHTLKTSLNFNMLRRSLAVVGETDGYKVTANSVSAGIAYGI